MSNPLSEFEALQSSADFLFVVFYRGHWCPFCCAYLKDLQSIVGGIETAHGKAITITSENADLLPTMRSQTGFTGEMIVDPENTIAAKLKASHNLSVAISERKGYPHGMVQPAVIVLKKDGTVLYQWAIVPRLMNIGGAKDRPSLVEIWEDVQLKLDGKDVHRESYSKQSFVKVMCAKIIG